MLFMVPLVALLLFVSWLLLRWIFPFSQKTVELKIEGGMKKNVHSYIVIATFFVTVLLWLCDTVTGINSYTVALIPLVVFALTGVINRQDLEEINWSVIWFRLGLWIECIGAGRTCCRKHSVW